jgi:hypothetical protein
VGNNEFDNLERKDLTVSQIDGGEERKREKEINPLAHPLHEFPIDVFPSFIDLE